MSLEPLQAPAWLIALGTTFFLGAKAVMLVRSGNGHGLPSELKVLLRETTGTLTALTARLQQLPTREDIKDVASGNRLAYRTDLNEAAGKIADRIDRAESIILKVVGRPT